MDQTFLNFELSSIKMPLRDINFINILVKEILGSPQKKDGMIIITYRCRYMKIKDFKIERYQ
jgi:hypothetical protein